MKTRGYLAFAIVGALLFGGIAWAGVVGPITDTQNLTGSAPTLVSQGLTLDGLTGYRVCISAASGQTLSGAGSLVAYVWSNADARWYRNPSQDLTQSFSGGRDRCFDDAEPVAKTGRVFYMTSGITVSGGTTVVTSLLGFKP